jgi:hypothetical protein
MAGIRRDTGAERAITDCGAGDARSGLTVGFALGLAVAAGCTAGEDGDDDGGVAAAVPISGPCRPTKPTVASPAPMSSSNPNTNHQRLFSGACPLSPDVSGFAIVPPDEEDPPPVKPATGPHARWF